LLPTILHLYGRARIELPFYDA